MNNHLGEGDPEHSEYWGAPRYSAPSPIEGEDWRLRSPQRYLFGVTLRWQRYRRYPPKPDWDHDHCNFCWAKFMVEGRPGVLHQGYCTLDKYHWICLACFDDFRERFQWHVARGPEKSDPL